jgi:2-oxoglutarate ferredoxin oxidoreductase subunit alpha
VLLPASPRDCYDFGMLAFDLAERLQTPVFVLSDLDLGMNMWMSDPFPYPDRPWDRGKLLTEEELKHLPKFERYSDVDGDGIPWRTLPGTMDTKGSYFTRGSGHDHAARYSERPEDYVATMDRLKRKLETARVLVPAPVATEEPGAEAGLVAYGTTHWAILEAREQLRAAGVPTGYLQLRALPFHADLAEFARRHRRLYVVEQNRDGQMADLIRLELAGRGADKVRSVLHYTGLPIDARFVTDSVLAAERGGTPPAPAEPPAALRSEAAGVSR